MGKSTLVPIVAFLGSLLIPGGAVAEVDATEQRLLRASEGLQMPGSEADSAWAFVSYPGEKDVPTADKMARITGCSDPMVRSDFDETFERLSRIEPWMDRGQRRSARGFGRLAKIFHREYGDDLAAYRCETGGPEVPVYFVGVNDDGLSGLKTVNIET